MKSKFGVGLAALALGASAGAATVPVDTFNTLQPTITDTNPAAGGVSSSIAGAGILGGERDLWADALTGAIIGEAGTRIGVTTPGFLSFSNDSGVAGMGRVQWDGVDASNILNVTGLGGFDLTLGGTASGFTVTTISSDADWNFEIILYTDANNWTQISLPANEVPTGTGPVESFIPFSGFTNAALCGTVGFGSTNFINCAPGNSVVDLTNLGAIDFWINTAAGANPIAFDIDLRLDSIVVPEPATLALFGIAMIAGGLARRQARKA